MVPFYAYFADQEEPMAERRDNRASIIDAVKDWLGLLALVVLAAETLLGIAYYSTEASDPIRKYYFPLMILFLAVIVVGVFVDRARSHRLQQTGPQPENARTIVLATRWYFKSGITEEELSLTISGNAVTGRRKTRHPKGKETTYDVTGWHHSSTYWIVYHLPADNYGGGSILLDEFTNDRLGGMLLSKDCDTGTMQCRANMWFPVLEIKRNHKEGFFKFIGSLTNAQFASGEPTTTKG